MYLFNLKIQATKKEIVKTTINGSFAHKLEDPLQELITPFNAIIDGASDAIPWPKLKIILRTFLIENFISEKTRTTNKENLIGLAENLIKELNEHNSAEYFIENYKPIFVTSDDSLADRIVENFSLMYIDVLTKSDISTQDIIKLSNTLLKEDKPIFNCKEYNNFNYLITKIITNPKVIENKAFFYSKNGEQGFLYQLVERSYKITGTFKKCATNYLDGVYILEHDKERNEAEKHSIQRKTVNFIRNRINENSSNYSKQEIYKMEEIYRYINNNYGKKLLPNDHILISVIKKELENLSDEQKIILTRNIEDLQRGILKPIKYEDVPALYENEELLIAYFRMVNYLLMNYPEAIGIEEYGKFVYTIKSTWHRFNNVLNNEMFYCFLYELYEKNYLKPKDYNHAWDFHLEGEEPADSLNVIFYSSQYKDKIDKTKVAAYKKLLFLQ